MKALKKLALLLAVVMVAALALTACGGESGSSGSDSASDDASGSTATNGQLVMATEAGFAPYEYYGEGNEIVGVDVDIANEIAKAMGKELVISDMNFDAILSAVSSGKADFGAAGLSITEERLKEVDFTIEYATSKQVIIVKEGSDITSSDDLAGKTVGVQTGTTADLYISDEMPDTSVQQYTKYMEAASDLLNGRIDAIVMDSLPADELVKANAGLVILEKELFTDKYGMAVKKGNTELLNQLNEVLQKLMDEGKIEEYTINHLS